MKIGVLVIDEFAECGTATWLGHAVRALSADQHEVVILKRPFPLPYLMHDGTSGPTIMESKKTDVLIKIANTCDAVVLQTTFDRDMLRGGQKSLDRGSWWLTVLAGITVPVTAFVHSDVDHTLERAKTLPRIVDHPKFIGKLLAHSIPDDLTVYGAQVVPLALPYATRTTSRPALVETDRVRLVHLGRINRVKNWGLSVRAAMLWDANPDLPRVDLHLHGPGADSPGTTISNHVFELLVADGAAPLGETPPNVHKATPWSVRLRGDSTVTFYGGYGAHQLPEILAPDSTLINGTYRVGSRGPTEYVCLEAIDHGLSVVQADVNCVEPRFMIPAFPLTKHVLTPPTIRGKNDAIVKDVANAIFLASHETRVDRDVRKQQMLNVSSYERFAAVVASALS